MSADERLERISKKEQEILQDLHVYGQYYEAKKMERELIKSDEDEKAKHKIQVIFSVAKRWDMSLDLARESYEIINEGREVKNDIL